MLLLIVNMEDIQELRERVVRRVYLITYSRADEELCESRQKFADMLLQAFSFNRGAVRPPHWVVCREAHEGGGFHLPVVYNHGISECTHGI